jgi:TRAP-type C4-dicarboxylate transport system substrate-binding protein
LVGAVVVTTTAWNELSPDDQKKLTDAARALETRIRSESPKEDSDSIAAMRQRGLEVIDPDAAAAAEIHAKAAELGKTMRGTMVPSDVYDLAAAARNHK